MHFRHLLNNNNNYLIIILVEPEWNQLLGKINPASGWSGRQDLILLGYGVRDRNCL